MQMPYNNCFYFFVKKLFINFVSMNKNNIFINIVISVFVFFWENFHSFMISLNKDYIFLVNALFKESQQIPNSKLLLFFKTKIMLKISENNYLFYSEF